MMLARHVGISSTLHSIPPCSPVSHRKTLTLEIEQLNGRLADAEARLKAEVLRIKKKMQITITELEMSLDVANKNNIELQKQIKKLSLQVGTECQSEG